MARVSLQIKNVASILLAAAASASSGVTVKMYLDHRNWAIPPYAWPQHSRASSPSSSWSQKRKKSYH